MNVLDMEKLKNLIHTVAHATGDMDGFGRTKLYKVMWFFEAKRYALHKEVFTGATYVRDKNGPRLKHYEKIFSEMEQEGLISCFDERFYNVTLKRVKSLKSPKGGLLNAAQQTELNYWIKYVSDKTAAEISEESHDYGWEIAKQNEELPLFAILAERFRDPDEEEMNWAKSRAQELNLP